MADDTPALEPPNFSLLTQLLDSAPDIFAAHVLPRLDDTDRNLLSRVSRQCKAAALALPFGVCVMCDGTGIFASLQSGVCPCQTHPLSVVRRKPPFADASKFLVSNEMIEWATEQGYATEDVWCVAKAAARTGNLSVLRHFNDNTTNCAPIVHEICVLAASLGHVNVLTWGYLNATVVPTVGNSLLDFGSGSIHSADYTVAEYINNVRHALLDKTLQVWVAAAENGRLNVLVWLDENGFIDTSSWIDGRLVNAIYATAAAGDLDVVKWFVENPKTAGQLDIEAAIDIASLHNQEYVVAFLDSLLEDEDVVP